MLLWAEIAAVAEAIVRYLIDATAASRVVEELVRERWMIASRVLKRAPTGGGAGAT
jgi:hypothetical protein